MKNKQPKKKILWWGWSIDSANHFGVQPRTTRDWRKYKGVGTSRAMKRNKLIEYCRTYLKASGLNEGGVNKKIEEAFEL